MRDLICELRELTEGRRMKLSDADELVGWFGSADNIEIGEELAKYTPQSAATALRKAFKKEYGRFRDEDPDENLVDALGTLESGLAGWAENTDDEEQIEHARKLSKSVEKVLKVAEKAIWKDRKKVF